MSDVHNLDIPCYKEIWKEIKEKYNHEIRIKNNKGGLASLKKVKRKLLFDYWKPILTIVYEKTNLLLEPFKVSFTKYK